MIFSSIIALLISMFLLDYRIKAKSKTIVYYTIILEIITKLLDEED
ncbi:hypothetical protein [Tissierella praeacuta]